jgi:hypothetical protein
MNENGPKTRQEVRKEMEDKHAREQRERDEGRGGGGGRHGGGQNYNNHDRGGNRDRRDGGGRNDRDRRDGDRGKNQYAEKKNTFQQKGRNEQPASPTKKGRGPREEKKAEEAHVEMIDITDEDMGEKLVKNFEAYCMSIKQLSEV